MEIKIDSYTNNTTEEFEVNSLNTFYYSKGDAKEACYIMWEDLPVDIQGRLQELETSMESGLKNILADVEEVMKSKSIHDVHRDTSIELGAAQII